jgi:hypothetical protein
MHWPCHWPANAFAFGECGVFANSLKRIGKWQMANARKRKKRFYNNDRSWPCPLSGKIRAPPHAQRFPTWTRPFPFPPRLNTGCRFPGALLTAGSPTLAPLILFWPTSFGCTGETQPTLFET